MPIEAGIDPLALKDLLWPDVRFYQQQQEIIYSVWNNRETVVAAGNMLGKDFVAAFIVLAFFLTRHPCHIVTTSVKDKHLNVFWGEIEKFIRIAKHPLLAGQGGPLLLNADGIRKVVGGQLQRDSYIMRLVASNKTIDSFQGHHATPDPGQPIDNVPRTLYVEDEASGVPGEYYDRASPWALRMLRFGNTWPCENSFKHAICGRPGTEDKGGDIQREDGSYIRRVFHFKAEHSPNVRLAVAQMQAGLRKPDKVAIKSSAKPWGVFTEDEYRQAVARWVAAGSPCPPEQILTPGILSWDQYVERRLTFNKVLQSVSLDATFYGGAELKLYPAEWLNLAAARAVDLIGRSRQAKAIGVDPGEGGAESVIIVVDDLGLLSLEAERTPDTAVIIDRLVLTMRKYNVPAERVLLDRGGGGKQLADMLRRQGYPVRTVAFGESVTPLPKHGVTTIDRRRLQDEERYAYRNRRAEMYGGLRVAIDPATGPVFAIPGEYAELRRQLQPIPLTYDGEGRLWLPPKQKRDQNDTRITMIDIIGCSPDQADALVLGVYGLRAEMFRPRAGAL